MFKFDLAQSAGRLNEGQRDCLRLVLGHMNSKEIGRELGVSPHTVDQRLRRSMRLLNASSRFEAARKFSQIDTENAYQSLIYQSPDVEKEMQTGKLGASVKPEHRFERDWKENHQNEHHRNADSGQDTDGDRYPRDHYSGNHYPNININRYPIPRYQCEKNQLTVFEKLGWIGLIAIGSALSFGGILAGLEALSRLRG